MRPKVEVRCYADNFAHPNERVVRFEDRTTRQRGHISLRQVGDTLEIALFDLTPKVVVFVPPGHNLN